MVWLQLTLKLNEFLSWEWTTAATTWTKLWTNKHFGCLVCCCSFLLIVWRDVCWLVGFFSWSMPKYSEYTRSSRSIHCSVCCCFFVHFLTLFDLCVCLNIVLTVSPGYSLSSRKFFNLSAWVFFLSLIHFFLATFYLVVGRTLYFGSWVLTHKKIWKNTNIQCLCCSHGSVSVAFGHSPF